MSNATSANGSSYDGSVYTDDGVPGFAEPPAGRSSLWSRTPLKARLIATLLILCGVGLVASSVAGSAQLHTYLYDRADKQLSSAADQAKHAVERRSNITLNLGDTPSQFYIRLYDDTGTAVGDTPLTDVTSEPALAGVTVASAAATGGKPFVVRSTNGKTRWRVTTRPFDDGSGSIAVALRLDDIDSTLSRLRLINLGVGAGVLAVLALLGFLAVRSSLRPLRDVEVTAAAIAAGDLSRRVTPGDPRTEVGRLSGALNGMLSQIETAFRAQAASESQARASEERMRRFVADASHELRTPLTSIRGFAELYRQGAVADQADVARVMRRVEEEAARMGLLVEDLLLLARLDQQRPLVQEPVDLLSIAADVVLDARARHPQRSIALIAGESSVPPVVLGDDARLRQVATNLVSNAILHTPPEASAAVSLQVEGDNAVLRVSDTGPGMPPAEAARVFERFYRADASRTRATAQNGSGLGLSIVAALVAAHGGTVEVESRLGVGTTFAVRLPLAPGDVPHPAPNGNSSSTQTASTQTPSIPAPIPPA
ncbi:MAG: hypothetical protein QOC60_1460 [Frankiaceae bacterium]|nr:hypothetical protein [Frankiaceae bacterium]